MFLFSCVIPFAFLIKMKFKKVTACMPNKEEEKCIKTILELEEDLFNTESKGVRWPIIQLYRMLIIVLVRIIVLNPIFKSSLFSVMFLCFVVHDWYRMPFKHLFLNHLQRLTSVCIFLVNLCSVPSAFSSVGDINTVPNMDIYLAVLKYFELVLYMIIFMSLPAWNIWKKYICLQFQKCKPDNK